MAGAEILKIFGFFIIRKRCQIRNDDIGLPFTFLFILWEDLIMDTFHISKKRGKERTYSISIISKMNRSLWIPVPSFFIEFGLMLHKILESLPSSTTESVSIESCLDSLDIFFSFSVCFLRAGKRKPGKEPACSSSIMDEVWIIDSPPSPPLSPSSQIGEIRGKVVAGAKQALLQKRAS